MIVEGKVKFMGGNVYLGNDSEWEWSSKISVTLADKYKDKEVEIIIRGIK